MTTRVTAARIFVGLFAGLILFPATPVLATGAVSSQKRPLSMTQAVNHALASNTQTLLARARKDEAAGQRISARSAFLPHLSGQISESRQKTNLAAQGFPSDLGPGLSSLITFNNFDARARLRQTLFDYSAWQDYEAAKIGENITNDQLTTAREQVATQAELDYVATLSTRQAVKAARANIRQAQALLKLARDQKKAGVATGVDVTRAEARLARVQADLAQRQTEYIRAKIQLARTVGLPLNANLELTDKLAFKPVPLGPVSRAISTALTRRPEIETAKARIAHGQRKLASAKGERLPTIAFEADYGSSGNTPYDNDRPTYAVGATLSMPLFAGGRISGQVDAAASRLHQQRIRLRDVRNQIKQDVRTSRQTLRTLAQRVRAANTNLELARQEMKRTRDRFAHGVADNVEVVDAQSNLADARYGRINALAAYTRARINLAAALGKARQFSLTGPASP